MFQISFPRTHVSLSRGVRKGPVARSYFTREVAVEAAESHSSALARKDVKVIMTKYSAPYPESQQSFPPNSDAFTAVDEAIYTPSPSAPGQFPLAFGSGHQRACIPLGRSYTPWFRDSNLARWGHPLKSTSRAHGVSSKPSWRLWGNLLSVRCRPALQVWIEAVEMRKQTRFGETTAASTRHLI